MPFLFPKSRAHRAVYVAIGLYSLQLHPNRINLVGVQQGRAAVEASLEAYDLFCRKYFGLGFVASFIPGTAAYQARMILSDAIEQLSHLLVEKINTGTMKRENAREYYHYLMMLRGSIVFSILRRLSEIRRDAFSPWRYSMQFNRQESLKILATYLPVFRYICHVHGFSGHISIRINWDRIAELIHTLCNPMRLVDDTLQFLLSVVYRIIEIGSVKDQESGPIRRELKHFAGVVFLAIKLPVAIVSTITDLPYQVLKHVIYAPLQFLALSLKQMLRNEDPIIVEHNDAAAMATLAKEAASIHIATKRQEVIASGIAAASQKQTVMIDDLTAIIANYRYTSINDDGMNPEPPSFSSHSTAGLGAPAAAPVATASPGAPAAAPVTAADPGAPAAAPVATTHEDVDLVNFPAYGDITPEQTAQYGLLASKPVPSTTLSNHFRLFKTTPHDKRIMRELVDIIHTEGSKKNQIEAARRVLVRSAAARPSR